MACSFVETSPDASSYRAETLGLYSIHAFIKAIYEFYNLPSASVDVGCDNKAALDEAKGVKKRISASVSCADVFRGIRSIKKDTTPIKWTYTWVKAHMDDILEWGELSRMQQLNVMCDTLAKQAVAKAIKENPQQRRQFEEQLLPHEQIAVYVDSIKQTTNIAEPIRYSCGKLNARLFLIKEMGWHPNQFEAVDWENLHACLQAKPEGFRTWLSKQHSNFCATRLQMKRWYGTEDSDCPSCGITEERADHLCRCKNQDRRNLLQTCTSDLVRWMSTGDNTHPDIIYWVEKYIMGQGTFPSCLDRSPDQIQELVADQQLIGWRNFMEGRISKQFYRVQFCHSIYAKTRMTAASWTRTFISKLLHITHSQWIFRNFMLHEKTHGILRLREQAAMRLHIEELILTNKNNLTEDNRFLLEFDIGKLKIADYETQCYWAAAVEAAREALLGSSNHPPPSHPQISDPPPGRRQQRRQDRQSPSDPHQVPRPSNRRPSSGTAHAREASNRDRTPD